MGDGSERHQRSDAQRNRKRLLDAAAAVFAEQGLEAGIGEIVARAGVGRGTLFRNFPTKQDLIAAVVVERIHAVISEGRELAAEGDDAEVAFEFIALVVCRHQTNRALFEAVDDEFLAQPEIRSVHSEFVELLEELLARGRSAGSVRPEVGELDVLLLVKGLCAAAAALDAAPDLIDRQVDLIGAAISTPEHAVRLRGRAPTLPDFEAAAAARAVTLPAEARGRAAR